MITCYVYPHTYFDALMKANKWNDYDISSDCAFISICCLPEIKHNYLENVKHETDEHWFSKNHSNVLNIEFDDITCPSKETEYGLAQGITKDNAKTIIDFIEQNKSRSTWYIHCRSGKRRSVAVGLFIEKYLFEKYGILVKVIGYAHGLLHFNTFVFDTLCKTAGLKNSIVLGE